MPGGLFRLLARSFVDGCSQGLAEYQERQAQQALYAQTGSQTQHFPQEHQYSPQQGYQQQTRNRWPQSPQHSSPPPPYPQPSPQVWNPASDTKASNNAAKQPAGQVQNVLVSTPTTPEENSAPAQQPAQQAWNGCAGPLQAITSGQGYCTSAVPDMDVCTACYEQHISSTPFASSFRVITYPSNNEHTCDLAVLAIQRLWLDICARAGPSPFATEKSTWLERFDKQYTDTSTMVQTLISQISTLGQEIQIQEMQQKHAHQVAERLVIEEARQMAYANACSYVSNDRVVHRSGELSYGRQKLTEAREMEIGIVAKKTRLEGLVKQLKGLIGVQ